MILKTILKTLNASKWRQKNPLVCKRTSQRDTHERALPEECHTLCFPCPRIYLQVSQREIWIHISFLKALYFTCTHKIFPEWILELLRWWRLLEAKALKYIHFFQIVLFFYNLTNHLWIPQINIKGFYVTQKFVMRFPSVLYSSTRVEYIIIVLHNWQ